MDRTSISFNSYIYGGSDQESPFPNMTRHLRDLAVASSTHSFDESVRYAHNELGVFKSYEFFFDHDAQAFIRFDRKQLSRIKNCQLQLGLVNRYQYEALRPFLLKFNREYQKTDMLTTLKTSNWTWSPSLYTNVETGTWSRKGSADNMLVLTSAWGTVAAKEFMQSVAYGKYQVNVERKLRSDFGIDTGYNLSASVKENVIGMYAARVPVILTDWMLFATYVNNFMYSANSIICDGKTGFFNPAYVMAAKPGKADKVLYLKRAIVLYPVPFPFFVQVTGDMGVERMLVTQKVNDTAVKVTRGTSIGANRLNFQVERPTDPFPPVSNPALWVCPPNNYMDGLFCDCNCGMTDPDCLTGLLKVRYCAPHEICSALGRCTAAIYDPAKDD
eukprot:g14105.t1